MISDRFSADGCRKAGELWPHDTGSCLNTQHLPHALSCLHLHTCALWVPSYEHHINTDNRLVLIFISSIQPPFTTIIQKRRLMLFLPSGQNGRVSRRQENPDCCSPEWVEKASWATLHLLDGHSEERPISAQPYLGGCYRSNWLWISRCGDYWQQAELHTDGACRIMMMMIYLVSEWTSSSVLAAF